MTEKKSFCEQLDDAIKDEDSAEAQYFQLINALVDEYIIKPDKSGKQNIHDFLLAMVFQEEFEHKDEFGGLALIRKEELRHKDALVKIRDVLCTSKE